MPFYLHRDMCPIPLCDCSSCRELMRLLPREARERRARYIARGRRDLRLRLIESAAERLARRAANREA